MPNSFSDLKKGFKNPPVDFSTAPFWVWNDVIAREKIDFQLREFKDKGIYMVFIHPRPGLITEYLGNEWFELVKYSLQKARELGMKIWLYDENSYPSGFAGGHVPAATFASSDPVAGLQMHRLSELNTSDTTNYFLIIRQIGDSFANITNARSKYYGQPGTYYGFTRWYYPSGDGWYGGFSYVDLLAYGITEKFLKITMDGYEEYIGEDFGDVMPGIFTDEPNIHTSGGNSSVIRFTPVLFNRFEKEYGYQLQNYLPCLYDEVGDWKNVRHDYQALLLDMFIERWSKPWEKFTNEKNLKWTGHYWEHGWPDPKHGGDNMAMYAYHQIPGIDMLFNTENRPDQFGNVRAVKELSSVVNQLDKERALSETYGGAGWELTFDDMKRQGDWEYVLGVNFMNQHLAHMTLKGARKRDYPQSMSYHTTWWEQYKPLNEYFHRLSFAMSAGKQVNRILVLEPTSTAWMHYSTIRMPGKPATIDAIKLSFHDLLDQLEKYQVEYDLGCETIMREHGSVQNGRLVIGQRAYDLIVLPPITENLMKPTFALFDEYLAQGGRILSISDVPERVDGNLTRKVSDLFDRHNEQIITAKTLDKVLMSDWMTSDEFTANNPEAWGGQVFHHRRKLKDGQLVFFTNYHKSDQANVSFSCIGRSVVELDLLSGDWSVHDLTATDGSISMSFSLPPSGSKLLFFSGKKESGPGFKAPDTQAATAIAASATTVERMHPNMLTIDYCDVEVEGKSYKNIYFYNAADSIFKTYLKEIYGYNYNPWSNAVQYRTRVLDKNTFGPESGFKVNYYFNIEPNYQPQDLRAVLESPQFYRVTINGIEVSPVPGAWWLDKDFGVFDIAEYVQPGRNTLEIRAQPMDILAEVEPVYLIGDFGVESTGNGWKIGASTPMQIGSWKSQSMPFYSHSVSYSKTVEKPVDGKAMVKLGNWSGTVAEVRINGSSAGIIGWRPYELDISDKLSDGQNKVEVIVTGSLKNLMGPHHMNPQHGFVTPWSFFRAPWQQPSGDSYDLLDYGLMEDFELIGF